MKKKILFVASEALPFATSGGLGDVIGSLPASLAKASDELDVRVVLPLYSSIKPEFREQMESVSVYTVQLAWRKQYCGVFKLEKDGVTYYFIDNEYYFKRDSMYGNFDDGERFAYFGKAVMEMMTKIEFIPDILHAHDWQSALSVIYLKKNYSGCSDFKNIKTIFTIHNIEYQGKYDFAILGDVFDISGYDKSLVEYGNCINLMKGAIECADKVTTVSQRYSEEILTPYYGKGMHFELQRNSRKLSGIINGIDYDYYNPQTDNDIEVKYTYRSFYKKAENKKRLQKELNLPEKDVPMIAMITRLTGHKGLDIVSQCAEELLQKDIQLVILGTGEKGYEAYFSYLRDRYPEKVSVNFKFDKPFSKRIYASSDIFLMPSKSEPCGLSQMIASRYGSVPVVRQTGGLYDTICEPDNGFTFYEYSGHELMYAINRALACYEDKEKWNDLVKKVMKKDFSWKASAEKYIKLYNED